MKQDSELSKVMKMRVYIVKMDVVGGQERR